MSTEIVFKSFVIWLVILILAVINGALREALFVPNLDAIPSMLLSGVLLSCIIFVVVYFLLPWVGARGSAQFVLIGAGWLVLTLIFEFSFGLSRGEEFSAILEAYTFTGGNLWPVVLLVTAVSPYVVARLKRLV